MARKRKARRTAAQKAATRKMLAANRARRFGRRARIVGRRVLRKAPRRRPPLPPVPGALPMARRRRRTRRPFFARRRRSARRGPSRRRRGAVRSGRRGFASLGGLIGIPVGMAAALGGAAVLGMAANAAGKPLPQIVKDYAPLAGAGVVAGLAYLAPKFRNLTVPALIGGALALGLQMYAAKKAGGAGAYNRLRGSGAVARVLGSGATGAGAVARVLGANAAA